MQINKVQECRDSSLSNTIHSAGDTGAYDEDLYTWSRPKYFTCSRCGSHKYTVLTENMVYQCYCCHYQSLDYEGKNKKKVDYGVCASRRNGTIVLNKPLIP